ncbi:conserved hypothetical protein [Crenothrix polyspora]|uniref:nitrite reductase (cytochrome; ammonia-forming) n=1 Tax=Crenothrix polyspora TaxID=360316 RepID=A0A1R4HBB8_9GAMM|nr:cytochrome c3 family protein [Crenothrix polyspora]SJM93509.1 conserved hypothetical protein [Crenothrix polyspora]
MLHKMLSYRFLGPILLIIVLGYFVAEMLGFGFRQPVFLPGKTSSAHHQIEIACDVCHTPLGGVKQEACLDCHKDALKADSDSHAIKVFNDPRSYALLAQIDAKKCVTCHAEHIADKTGNKVASVPDDFCYACHKEITTERASHKDFSMDGCTASGCHNYHDNQALYENFIAQHLNEANTLALPRVPARNMADIHRQQATPPLKTLIGTDHDGISSANDAGIVQDWAASGHAHSGVNCSDCHSLTKSGAVAKEWTNKPDIAVCENCHKKETKGFLNGKHGMRLAVNLSPMTPEMARIPMKDNAHNKELNCNSCHSPHRSDTKEVAVEACLTCHDDSHSKAYINSPHHQLWKKEITGELPVGSGVSCATCHLPRLPEKEHGLESILVMHNQNMNLRPNSKMIRSVCMNCHGLGFSLDALADPALMINNYSTLPSKKINTLNMIQGRKIMKKQSSSDDLK